MGPIGELSSAGRSGNFCLAIQLCPSLLGISVILLLLGYVPAPSLTLPCFTCYVAMVSPLSAPDLKETRKSVVPLCFDQAYCAQVGASKKETNAAEILLKDLSEVFDHLSSLSPHCCYSGQRCYIDWQPTYTHASYKWRGNTAFTCANTFGSQERRKSPKWESYKY
ncbi:hypothetical protein TRVL_00732 [Trypanosoma vivax]|nr:hypothetical protein TRVL_00732 [Trypanosoma vivax]